MKKGKYHVFYFNYRLPWLGRYISRRSRGSANRCWNILWKTLEEIIVHSCWFFNPWRRRGSRLMFFILQVRYLWTNLLVVLIVCLWIGVNWCARITNLWRSADSALFQIVCMLQMRDKLKLQAWNPLSVGEGLKYWAELCILTCLPTGPHQKWIWETFMLWCSSVFCLCCAVYGGIVI